MLPTRITEGSAKSKGKTAGSGSPAAMRASQLDCRLAQDGNRPLRVPGLACLRRRRGGRDTRLEPRDGRGRLGRELAGVRELTFGGRQQLAGVGHRGLRVLLLLGAADDRPVRRPRAHFWRADDRVTKICNLGTGARKRRLLRIDRLVIVDDLNAQPRRDRDPDHDGHDADGDRSPPHPLAPGHSGATRRSSPVPRTVSPTESAFIALCKCDEALVQRTRPTVLGTDFGEGRLAPRRRCWRRAPGSTRPLGGACPAPPCAERGPLVHARPDHGVPRGRRRFAATSAIASACSLRSWTSVDCVVTRRRYANAFPPSSYEHDEGQHDGPLREPQATLVTRGGRRLDRYDLRRRNGIGRSATALVACAPCSSTTRPVRPASVTPRVH